MTARNPRRPLRRDKTANSRFSEGGRTIVSPRTRGTLLITIVLPPSEIGEIAVFARRSGRRWFLAVMNGPTARTVRIPLSFLGNGKYQALLVRDQPENPAAVKIESAILGRGDSVEIELRSGGGFIARFLAIGSPGSSFPSQLFPRVHD